MEREKPRGLESGLDSTRYLAPRLHGLTVISALQALVSPGLQRGLDGMGRSELPLRSHSSKIL